MWCAAEYSCRRNCFPRNNEVGWSVQTLAALCPTLTKGVLLPQHRPRGLKNSQVISGDVQLAGAWGWPGGGGVGRQATQEGMQASNQPAALASCLEAQNYRPRPSAINADNFALKLPYCDLSQIFQHLLCKCHIFLAYYSDL